MTRQEAYLLLTKYLQNKNLIKHCLACEAAMKAICQYLHPQADDEERETWGITGLLHDADYEIAQKDQMLHKHGLLLFEKESIIPERIVQAIKAHNFEHTQVMPKSDMDWAIACVDQLTGLIIACALIKPEKRLDAINVDFVLKRFSEKAFAKGARRESIKLCEQKLSIPLKTFIQITLNAMQHIHAELGL